MHLSITGQRQDRSAWLGEAVEANLGGGQKNSVSSCQSYKILCRVK